MGRLVLKKVAGLIHKKITPADTFLRNLDDFIEKKNSDRPVPSKSFKPSSMKCDRNMWYQLHGSTPDEGVDPVNLVRICENGSDSHERIQQYIIDMGKEEDSIWEYYDVEKYIKENNLVDLEIVGKNGLETKVFNKKYNIRFQTDGILYNRLTKTFYIFEFKTEGSNKWNIREDVDPNHYYQADAYLLSFEIKTGVIFVYEDRNMLGHKAFLYPYNEERVNNLKARLLNIIQMEKDNILPEATKDKKACLYCHYSELCKFNRTGD